MTHKHLILSAVTVAIAITLAGCGGAGGDSGGSGMSAQEAEDFRAKEKARTESLPATRQQSD